MTLRLDEVGRRAMRDHAESAYPEECCGVLGGTYDGGGLKAVQEVVRLPNARGETSRRRYLIDPVAYRRVEGELGAAGLEVIGVYHSHPDAPARPSPFDLAHAWPWLSYVIVSVEHGRATALTSWILDDDRRAFGMEPLCL